MFTNYDDVEIGALECEEIEGELDVNCPVFKQAAEEFEKEQKRVFKFLCMDGRKAILFDMYFFNRKI